MSDTVPVNVTADDVARMVMLVYGTMSNTKPFWCFVAVRPSRYEELKRKVADKSLDLTKYVDDGFGEIVVSGEGVIPPNDVIKTISTMFNVPIRQLFADVDLDSVINKEIQRIKSELGGA